ncbi:MAG: hypothetical protein AAF098_06620 [Pseudomonadota bacterium]
MPRSDDVAAYETNEVTHNTIFSFVAGRLINEFEVPDGNRHVTQLRSRAVGSSLQIYDLIDLDDRLVTAASWTNYLHAA